MRVGFTERPTRMLGASERSVVSAAAGATLNALADLLRLTAADAETLKRELDPRSISPAASHLAARKRE